MQSPPTTEGPSQPGEGSRPGSFGKAPEMTRYLQVRWKSNKSVRIGRGQSPILMTSDWSRTSDKASKPKLMPTGVVNTCKALQVVFC